MANGDIRGLDISSTVPTQSSRYQAPQVQAPNISSGYGELAGAYDYATKAVLKGFQALGSIAEDHLELERSNRWTETQRAINNLFQKKNFESGDFLAGQGQSDLSWNDEHGEVPALRTIKNYIDDSIQQGDEIVSLESILETVKDDSKLHNGAIALIDNRRFALTTKMHTDITKMQVERGKNLVESHASEIDQYIYDQIIIATDSSFKNPESNNVENFKIVTDQISDEKIDPWLQNTNNLLKLSKIDAKPFLAKANKFWPKVAKTRFKEIFNHWAYGETPEKLLELWDSGHFDIEGHIYTLDETGQIVKGPKVKIPVPKQELAQEIRFLTSPRLKTSDAKKANIQKELLTALAKQKPLEAYKMLKTQDGVKQFNINNEKFGANFGLLKDDKYKPDLIKIATLAVTNYKALQEDTTKDDFQETDFLRVIQEKVDQAMEVDSISIWDSTKRPKDNSKHGARLKRLEEEVDVILEDIIPLNKFDTTKTSVLIESLNKAKSFQQNASSQEVYRSLDRYIGTVNRALQGDRTTAPEMHALRTSGLEYDPKTPMTEESWANYQEVSKNQTGNGNALLPASQKEKYTDLLKPKKDGGKLEYRPDGPDTLGQVRFEIMNWAGPKADEVWKDFTQHLSDQGGFQRDLAETYGRWDVLDNEGKINFINGASVDSKDDKSTSRTDLYLSWEKTHDTYMDTFENPTQRNAHRNIILTSANVLDADASDDQVLASFRKSHEKLSKDLVVTRMEAGNVIAVPDWVMTDYYQYIPDKKDALAFMGKAIVANFLTNTKEGIKRFDELFPESDDKNFREMRFKGSTVFRFANTPEAKRWIIDALVYEQLGNLQLSVGTSDKGLKPTLFYKEPSSLNTGGVTIFEWDATAKWETIQKQWAFAKPGVQFLERLEGITGIRDKMTIKVGDDPKNWIEIPFNVGDYDYDEFVQLYEDTSKIPQNKLKPSIGGVWPNHAYQPGLAELKTMELIMGDVQDELKRNYHGHADKETINKIFYKRIDFYKKRWNAWSTRVGRAKEGLLTRRAVLGEDGIIRFLTPEDDKYYKSGGAFGLYDREQIEAIRNRNQ
jgi:hypothetical protein